jgi:diguanylate cyclase (GGDEF)-like protein/PAS domain S-box-containing protein
VTSRSGRALAAAIALTCALFAAWLGFRVGGATVTQAVDDIGDTLAAFFAAGACLWAARHRPRRYRATWTLLGFAGLAWGAAEAVWSYHEVLLGRDTPFPSVADIGYLAAVPFAIAAVLAYPTNANRSPSRTRTVFDALIVTLSLLFVSWATVLGPLFRAHAGSVFTQVLALGYPITDVVMVAAVIFATTRGARGGRGSLALIGAGLIGMAFADTGFAILKQQNADPATVLNAGWFIGYMLIALAALWPAEEPEAVATESAFDERSTSGYTIMLPYAPGLVSLGIIVVLHGIGRSLGPFLETTGIVMLILVGGRQFVTLVENLSLTRDLEQRVVERTAQLREHEQRFSALVQHSSDVVTIVAADGTISYQSPSIERVYGMLPADVVGRPFTELLHPEDVPRWHAMLGQAVSDRACNASVVWQLRHASDAWRATESLVTSMLDDESVRGVVVNSRDIGDRVALEEQLRHQALHDPLTSLANRALFQDRLDHALARRSRDEQPLAVVFLDVDNFKAVNDGRGHVIGDELLKMVGTRLVGAVRPGDTVARLGGDEFAVLLEPLGERALDVAQRILEALRRPFQVADADVFVQASLGIAQTDTGKETAEDLLRNADVAMYVAKANGKARVETFEAAMHEAVINRLQLETDMRRGIDTSEFVLYYQPIVRLPDGDIVGVEALARWLHPERGIVMPEEFIPAAEATGLIVPLGAWLMSRACIEIKAWQDRIGRPDLTVNVNVSPQQLRDPELLDIVGEALRTSGLAADRLTLELTESTLMEPTDDLLETLRALKDLGVKLSIDDFGTGYSSLSYLQHLPVDQLKIDRAFIAALERGDEASAVLVRKIIGLAGDLNLTTTAEGVEDPHQLAELNSDGCANAQGFLFARPMPASELEHLFSATSELSA